MTTTSSNSEHAAQNSAGAGALAKTPLTPAIVGDLMHLVDCGAKFATIYADPPWPYSNTAARGAAENHYPTLTLETIRAEPVKALAAENAHLHLWTTNAFLREAFEVIRAWGFKYKSCLVWVKPQIGMGNYWRVSHEYLLLGVRGQLPFQNRTVRSWQLARRTVHSRKPFLFRGLIEQVSPDRTWSCTAEKSNRTATEPRTAIKLNGGCFESAGQYAQQKMARATMRKEDLCSK